MTRRRDLFAALLLALLPLVFPGPVILGAPGLPGADLPQFHLPHQRFICEHLREGIIPFWNPRLYGGAPEFGNPEMAPMYPTNFVLLMALGPVGMLKVKFLLHLALLGLGAYLFLRSLSVGRGIAFAAALTLEISGFPITRITLPNVGDSAAWIPLMLWLAERFRRRPNTDRGLWLALGGGTMLLLFFPQITLTLMLVVAAAGAVRFAGVRSHAPHSRAARWIGTFALPIAELAIVASMLRYPPRHIAFPEPGWRCAFDGMGGAGLGALGATVLLGGAWWIARRAQPAIRWRALGRWAIGSAGVWAMAAMFAAPQLAITGEMIPLSNQSGLDYRDESYFTGAQAYGSVREFVEQSARAARKESVNNMALGPLPWLLALAGIAGGFHRRHRWFLFLLAGAGLTLLVYMAAPGAFDIFIRLPFFGKFAGLSRYLAFLNAFLVLLAALSAALWLRRTGGGLRKALAAALALAFAGNTALLVRHQADYWTHLRAHPAKGAPPAVARMARMHGSDSSRMLVDARGTTDFVPLLMFTQVFGMQGLQGYGPIRLAGYDTWLGAHNRRLGVAHDDYRAPLFEPVPTRRTRALRVDDFLFAPGQTVPDAARDRLEPAAGGIGPDTWRLMRDRHPWPPAWPAQTDGGLPESPALPTGWSAEWHPQEPNRMRFLISNPGPAVRAELCVPWYPGWTARVNGQPAPVERMHDFLQAVPIESGPNVVDLTYRPRSFAWGWLAFLWATGAWIALRLRSVDPLSPLWRWALPALALAAAAAPCVFLWPDALILRLGEFAAIMLLMLAWGNLSGAGRKSSTPSCGRG